MLRYFEDMGFNPIRLIRLVCIYLFPTICPSSSSPRFPLTLPGCILLINLSTSSVENVEERGKKREQ